MLESEIKKLTVAIEANTAALLGGVAPVAAVAKPTADVTAEAKPKADPKPVPAPPPADDGKSVTKQDVVKAIVSLGKAKGREIVMKIFAEYGITKLPELKDKSKYGELLAKLQAAEKA